MAKDLQDPDGLPVWARLLSWQERCVYDRAYSRAWADNGQNDRDADRKARASVEKRRKA